MGTSRKEEIKRRHVTYGGVMHCGAGGLTQYGRGKCR